MGFDIQDGVLVKYIKKRGETEVVIPDGVKEIGHNAFDECKSLTSVIIPDGVISIGDSAFWGCSGLTSITIPNSVIKIGRSAFERCKSLTSVTIPDSVTSIGSEAFKWCGKLESVLIPDSITEVGGDPFSDTPFYKNDNRELIVYGKVLYRYRGTEKNVNIPDGVTKINGGAFSGCTDLISVTIPNTVTKICNSAFYGCTSLSSVIIPDSMTSIGDSAFKNCKSLMSVTIPDSVTSIGSEAFKWCDKLACVLIPDSIIEVGNDPFSDTPFYKNDNRELIVYGKVLYRCRGAEKNESIPEGVIKINESAFSGCTNLISVTIPNTVTEIGKSAFNGCTSLTSLIIPDSVTSIGNSAFNGCTSLTSVTIPENVTRIAGWAFEGCTSLTSVVLPDSVTSIGFSAFSGCSNLTSMTIPGSVMEIGSEAFRCCKKLTSVTIPENVKDLGENIFIWSGLTSVTLLCSAKLKLNMFENTPLAENFGKCLPSFIDQCENMDVPLLKESVFAYWENIPTDKQCEIFLKRQDKALNKYYIQFISKEDAQNMSIEFEKLINDSMSSNDCNSVANFICLFVSLINEEQINGVYNKLKLVKNGKKAITALEKNPEVAQYINNAKTNSSTDINDIEKDILSYNSLSVNELTLNSTYSLVSQDLPDIQDQKGAVLKPFVLAYILIEANEPKSLEINSNIMDLISRLDDKTFQAALVKIIDFMGGRGTHDRKHNLAYPICLYGNEATVAELCKRAQNWGSMASGKEFAPLRIARQAMLYSNTHAAMLFADKYDDLDKYAGLRGIDPDTLRDLYLSDVGLDKDGGKAYDLGNTSVTVRLQPDMTYLFELPDGKTAKSLPKKNADPEKYEAAKEDFAQLKKSARKILTNRFNRLFEDFLSGRSRPADDWKKAYLENPLLMRTAKIVVWAQGKKTFILTDSGIIDSGGTEYVLTDKPISVAHPMDMATDDVARWQRYFTTHGLKQPFSQIWEPVHNAVTIKADRYEGFAIELKKLMYLDRHGIHTSLSVYSKKVSLMLDGCNLNYELSSYERSDPKASIMCFKDFTFETYTRTVNHIINVMDNISSEWIINKSEEKDDTSIVMERVEGMTLAQIMDFIALAQKHEAVNVLAALLEYKNKTYPDYDFMDEFVLDW